MNSNRRRRTLARYIRDGYRDEFHGFDFNLAKDNGAYVKGEPGNCVRNGNA